MSRPAAAQRETWILTAIFVLSFLYSLYGVTYNWTMGFMSGHEFRQAHTAIVAYHIDQQNNFSLLYETPIFGKPWVSLLLEVPVYEWSVVLLSRATGLPHVVAARTITAVCFYLTLPAVWLLLGRLAVPKPRRLLLLALMLSAPVYIYYSRAFLMDSMALMCSAWFLIGFVRTMDERRWSWLALTIVAGTGAALIKSAILAVWMVPGAAYGAWMLWRDVRAGQGWIVPLKTLLWGAATVGVALGALRWWVAYTDPIKAAHPSAWIFTSKNLSQGNWGLFDFKAVFSPEVWRALIGCWEQAMMSRWLIAVFLVAGCFLPGVRWKVLGTGALFFAAQLLFPYAYAYQDYYFYANAAFLHVAIGFTLLGLLDSRLPRWVVGLVCLMPFAAQAQTYWQGYRVGQSSQHTGGYPFTKVLRDLTPQNSVLIVAGADWAAMTPLYAERKALMLRNGLEHDRPYLERALKAMEGEDVSALVVIDKMRGNRELIKLVADRFDLDPTQPTFSSIDTDVYVSRSYAKAVQVRLRDDRRYQQITMQAEVVPELPAKGLIPVDPVAMAGLFENIRPMPYQVNFEFGSGVLTAGLKVVLSVHPSTDLWLSPPADATKIGWSFGIFPGAYENPESHTDGVEFLVHGELPDGTTRSIYRRLLDPAKNGADRGEQNEVIRYTPLPGEKLRFSTRPNAHSTFDWAYIIHIKVE